MPLVSTCSRRVAIALGFAFLAACSPSAPAESASPSAAPSDGAATSAACDDSVSPSLIGPDGEQVVLGDGPGGNSTWDGGSDSVYYLRQIGDCIWIVNHVALEDEEPPFLSTFQGRLGSDFLIVGTFADMNGQRIPGYDHGETVLRVTFEGDETVLVEDRTNTGPPGCFGGDGPCPEPLELRRAEP